MNRFLSVSQIVLFLLQHVFVAALSVLMCVLYFLLQKNSHMYFLCRVDLQSLSEEEQTRVLSEEKIGFKKGGANSLAAKKRASKAKVRPSSEHSSHLLRYKLGSPVLSIIFIYHFEHNFIQRKNSMLSWLLCWFYILLNSKSSILCPFLIFPLSVTCRPIQRNPKGQFQPCSSSLRRSVLNCSRSGRTFLTASSQDSWLACGTSCRIRRR